MTQPDRPIAAVLAPLGQSPRLSVSGTAGGAESPRSRVGESVLGGKGVVIALAILVLAGIAIQLSILTARHYPGDADAGYYFNIARNLIQGRGFVADTLWYFGFNSPTVEHYGGAYWKPVTALLAAGGMKLFGATVAGALLPSYLLSWVLAGCAALSARVLTADLAIAPAERRILCGLAFFTCLFHGWVFWCSINVVPVLPFAVLGFGSLFLVQRLDTRLMPLAGFLAGLAALTRNDGVFLVPVVFLFLLAVELSWGRRVMAFGLFIVGMLVPLVAERLYSMSHGFHSSNPLQLLFMTSFDDMNLLPGQLTLGHLLHQSPVAFVADRIKAMGLNFMRIFEHFGTLLTLLALWGAFAARSSMAPPARRFVLIWALFLGFEYVANSVILPYTGMEGTFRASFAVAFPAGIALAFLGLFRLGRNVQARAFLGVALVLSVAVPGLMEASRAVRAGDPSKVARDQRIGRTLDELAAQDGIEKSDVTVIGRIDTGNFAVLTGYRLVFTPSGGEDAVKSVIDRYRPQYLALTGGEPGLTDIYTGARSDPSFEFAATVPGTDVRIFRIVPPIRVGDGEIVPMPPSHRASRG